MGAYIIEDDVNRQLAERRQARRHRYPEEYPVAGCSMRRGGWRAQPRRCVAIVADPAPSRAPVAVRRPA